MGVLSQSAPFSGLCGFAGRCKTYTAAARALVPPDPSPAGIFDLASDLHACGDPGHREKEIGVKPTAIVFNLDLSVYIV